MSDPSTANVHVTRGGSLRYRMHMPAPTSRADHLCPCRVLVVEQDVAVRRLLRKRLETNEFSSLVVPSCEEAIGYLSFKFDALVADLDTGIMSLEQFVDYIRFESPNIQIPIIITTSVSPIPEHLDVQAVLKKPLDLPSLRQVLRKATANVSPGFSGVIV